MILLKEPNAPEILAMLGEIESRLQAAGHSLVEFGGGAKTGLIANPHANGSNGYHANGNGADAGLIDTNKRGAHLQERGDDQLAKFLVMQQLFPEEEAKKALEAVNQINRDLSGQALCGVAARESLR